MMAHLVLPEIDKGLRKDDRRQVGAEIAHEVQDLRDQGRDSPNDEEEYFLSECHLRREQHEG